MKTVSIYMCEICNSKYQDGTDATACEATHITKSDITVHKIVFSKQKRMPDEIQLTDKSDQSGTITKYRKI